jgi:VWFA-related protein
MLLLVLTLAPALIAQEATGEVFRSGVSDVAVDVQVVQGDQLITDLRQEDFIVLENGQPQSITSFSLGREPLALTLLLDISGSMRKYLEQVAQVARESLRFLETADQVSVMVFARNAKVRLPFTGDRSEVADEIRQAIGDETLGAGTSINEAAIAAARHTADEGGTTGRRAVLIITDNLGLNYRSPDEAVIRALEDTNTVLNAIVVGKGRRPEAETGNGYTNPDFTTPDVFKLSEVSGGEAVKADQAGRAFARMIERIRTRYSVHYNQPESGPGYRRIEVKLTLEAQARYPKAELRHRKGYRTGAVAESSKAVE